MRLFIATLFLLLFTLESQAQSNTKSIINSNLYGTWTFVEYNIVEKECEGVTLDPINLISFTKKGEYTIKQDSITLNGNYKLIDSKVTLFNTKKNDVRQKGTESLIIYSIEKQKLAFELPIECGMIYIEFKKEKD